MYTCFYLVKEERRKHIFHAWGKPQPRRRWGGHVQARGLMAKSGVTKLGGGVFFFQNKGLREKNIQYGYTLAYLICFSCY